MRVAFGSLLVSFGPVDPPLGTTHTRARPRSVQECATVKKLPAAPIHHRGLKGPAERVGRDSRIRDVAIAVSH